MCHAAACEFYEETGLKALQIGLLAWIIQIIRKLDQPIILVFVIEVTAWRGDIIQEYEVEGGSVRRAEFVTYTKACERLIHAAAIALRD